MAFPLWRDHRTINKVHHISGLKTTTAPSPANGNTWASPVSTSYWSIIKTLAQKVFSFVINLDTRKKIVLKGFGKSFDTNVPIAGLKGGPLYGPLSGLMGQ